MPPIPEATKMHKLESPVKGVEKDKVAPVVSKESIPDIDPDPENGSENDKEEIRKKILNKATTQGIVSQ